MRVELCDPGDARSIEENVANVNARVEHAIGDVEGDRGGTELVVLEGAEGDSGHRGQAVSMGKSEQGGW